MLQQTQVERVIPYYELFIHQFPTITDLANAPLSTVITLWSGLGYNKRAVFLQNAAKGIIKRRSFPKTREDLQKLSGIGPYTAEAVLAFAFNYDAAPADTNIRRIFSRYFFKGAGTVVSINKMIQKELPKGKARVWNNALMDFGSIVCTASSPQCLACPLATSCRAYRAGNQESYLRFSAPQSRFEGSIRQMRGRIIEVLREARDHQLSIAVLAKKVAISPQMLNIRLQDLQKDGLVIRNGKTVRFI